MSPRIRKRAFIALGLTSVLTLTPARTSAEEAQTSASTTASAPPSDAAAAEGDGEPSALASAITDTLFERGTAGGLTAEQVSRSARATSYRAAAQRQALRAAEARLDEALVAYFPRLSATGAYTRFSKVTPPVVFQGLSFPALPNSTLLQASLVVPLSDYLLRISQTYAGASHSLKAVRIDEAAARLNSGLEGRVAYYTWLRARAQVHVAERNLRVSQAHVTDARNAFEVGTVSVADILGAEAQVARAELVLEQEHNAVIAAEDQIRVAMHDTSGRAYPIGEDLRRRPGPPELRIRDLESLRREALEKRLELRALDETVWSLREQAKVVKAGLYPRIDGFADLMTANPNQRIFPQQNAFNTTWDLGIRLSWSPNDALTAGGAAAEARAQAEQTRMQREALTDSVKTEVLQAYHSLAEASLAIQTTVRALIAAEESYRARRELFRNGRATSVEMQDAEVALFQAGFESVNAHANVKIAAAKLAHAVGWDIEELAAPSR